MYIYASVNSVNSGSDSGLAPLQRQDIIRTNVRSHTIVWTNAGRLSIGTLKMNFGEIIIKTFVQENAFQTVVCKMVVIFVLASMC